MQAYFNDEFNLDNEWLYTHIDVKDKIIPFYQLYTGGQHSRFILSSPKNTLYFGYVKPYFWGAVLLRLDTEIEYENMPIPAISSADIQNSLRKNSSNEWRYWANFYAKALLNSSKSFLKQGKWRILPTTSYETEKKTFISSNDEKYQGYAYRFNRVPLQKFSSIKNFSDYQTLVNIEWGVMASDNYIILLKQLPESHSGRVKFWQKQIRESSCPPLLVWYQPHLHAYLLVDGHARFQAYLLENREPKILAIEQFVKQTYEINEAEREKERVKVFSGLEKSLEKSQKPLSTDSLNSIMLQLYDDYSHDKQTLMAKPISDLDNIWRSYLNQLITSEKISSEQLEFFTNEETR